MKVVFLMDECPPENTGGAGIVAFEQVLEMARRGVEVSVITTTRDRSTEGTAVYKGVQVRRIYTYYPERWRGYYSIYNPATVGKVRDMLAELRPDVVHAHNVHQWLSYWTLVIARRYTRVVCMTVRDAMLVEYGKLVPRLSTSAEGPYFDYTLSFWKQLKTNTFRFNPFRNKIHAYIAHRLDALYTPSHALKEGLEANGVKVTKVIHEGINVEVFSSAPDASETLREKFDLKGKKILLFGGRVSEAKGAQSALNILRALPKSLEDTVLLLVGKKDEYVASLMRQARALGLEKRVVCTGWVPRETMPDFYRIADAVLVLSIYLDPFPTVNLEAMSMKRPVIGTLYGGTPEAVEHGVTGYIVDPQDTKRGVQAVEKILLNSDLTLQLGEKGFLRVKEKFNVQDAVTMLEKEFERLLKIASLMSRNHKRMIQP